MGNIYYIIPVIVILVLVVIFFNKLSEFFYGGQKDKNPRGELLRIIIQVLGGIILLFGAYYSLQIADSMHDNNKLIEKGNIAERFKNAINMLEDINSNTRLGGMYALNNIAKDNSEYREQVFNILIQFINNKTESLPSWYELNKPKRFIAQPSIEITTILKLLFSKNDSFYRNYNAHFKNAKLYGGIFDKYNFSRCIFENVEFQNSSFNSTLFIESKIFNSNFSFSDFSNTLFTGSVIRDSSRFICCRFSWASFRISFIQGTDFSCSNISDVYFDGALVNICKFNGVELKTFYGEDEGSFLGSSFSSIDIKGLVCYGKGIIARGASFESGVPLPPTFKLKNSIGKKAKINIIKELEDFPKSKVKYYKNIMGNYSNVKSHGGSLLNLEHNNFRTTGWVFADTSILTEEDFNNIEMKYNKVLKKISRLK